MNQSQLYLLVSTGSDDESEVEMLMSTHLRPYASLCAAAHYDTGKIQPEEKLSACIKPCNERSTIIPDTRCLLSFVVDIENRQGELIGSCDFKRAALIDYVSASALRIIAKRNNGGEVTGREESEIITQNMKYCLHFSEVGVPVEPRVKIPPVREAQISALTRKAHHVQTAVGNGAQSPVLMTTLMRREVYHELEDLAERSERDGLEKGCFLDGEVLYDPERREFARLFTEFIPARSAERSEASLRINGDCWSQYYCLRSGRGVLLAEGHSHPSAIVSSALADTTMFLSSSDKQIHRLFFWQFFQSTVIVSKPEPQGFQMGVWGWSDGLIVPEHDAYVIDE